MLKILNSSNNIQRILILSAVILRLFIGVITWDMVIYRKIAYEGAGITMLILDYHRLTGLALIIFAWIASYAILWILWVYFSHGQKGINNWNRPKTTFFICFLFILLYVATLLNFANDAVNLVASATPLKTGADVLRPLVSIDYPFISLPAILIPSLALAARERCPKKVGESLESKVVQAIKEFEPNRKLRDEKAYENSLYSLLKIRFPEIEVKVQKCSSIPNIVINNIAIEIKGPIQHTDKLDFVSSKLMRYPQDFEKIIVVLFDLNINDHCYENWLKRQKKFSEVEVIRKD